MCGRQEVRGKVARRPASQNTFRIQIQIQIQRNTKGEGREETCKSEYMKNTNLYLYDTCKSEYMKNTNNTKLEKNFEFKSKYKIQIRKLTSGLRVFLSL